MEGNDGGYMTCARNQSLTNVAKIMTFQKNSYQFDGTLKCIYNPFRVIKPLNLGHFYSLLGYNYIMKLLVLSTLYHMYQ